MEQLGIDATTTPGRKVAVRRAARTERSIYSKQDRGRFPEDGEVVRLLES